MQKCLEKQKKEFGQDDNIPLFQWTVKSSSNYLCQTY